MTKLNEYFENKLSAQEQLEVQMWLAENGYNPDTEAQLEELFDKLHVDDEAAAKAAFQQVASRLGITAEARKHDCCRCVSPHGANESLQSSSFRSCAQSACSTPPVSRK